MGFWIRGVDFGFFRRDCDRTNGQFAKNMDSRSELVSSWSVDAALRITLKSEHNLHQSVLRRCKAGPHARPDKSIGGQASQAKVKRLPDRNLNST